MSHSINALIVGLLNVIGNTLFVLIVYLILDCCDIAVILRCDCGDVGIKFNWKYSVCGLINNLLIN